MRVILQNNNGEIIFQGVVADPEDYITLNQTSDRPTKLECKVTHLLVLAVENG